MLNESVYARPEFGPPSIQLRDNLSNVTVARLVEIKPDFSLLFEKVSDLHSTAEDEFLVASDEIISSLLNPGAEYIVAYTKYQVDRRSKSVSIKRGPATMLGLPGAQPAIFRLSDALLQMFGLSIEESLKSPIEILPVIWSQIENRDVQIQKFFVAELLGRETLLDELGKKEFKKLISMMTNPNTDSEIRTLILTSGRIPNSVLSDRKLKKLILTILSTESVNLDVLSSDSAFYRTCFKKLAGDFEALDLDLLERWLQTNSLGVLHYIMGHIQRFYPEREKMMLSGLADRTLMNSQNREVIKARLERLQ